MATTDRVITARIVAGLTLAGLLAGCATDQQTTSSSDHTGPARTTTSPQSSMPHHEMTLKAVPLHVSQTPPNGTISATWSMRPIANPATSRRVYLFVVVPLCSGGKMSFTMTNTSRAIEIGYWIHPIPKHAACSALRVTTNGYIQLPRAIGNRAIVHVPLGRHAPSHTR